MYFYVMGNLLFYSDLLGFVVYFCYWKVDLLFLMNIVSYYWIKMDSKEVGMGVRCFNLG